MPRLGRLIRSLGVSAATTVLSLTILAVLTRFDLASPAVANVIATVAGIGPSFELNRRWAWHRTDRGHLTREVAPFWGYCLLALVLSTIAVARAGAWADAIDVRPGTRTAIILAANVATFGTLWIGQFLLLDKVLFRPSCPGSARSQAAPLTSELAAASERRSPPLCRVDSRISASQGPLLRSRDSLRSLVIGGPFGAAQQERR